MKILAMDSSGLPASAAVMEDGTLLAEYTVNFKMTHSQTLLPMIDAIMKITGVRPQDIDVIAIAGGPGSFTGLRIGSATAKGIGLAWDIPVMAVQTVDALAWNLCGTQGLVCPMMDARRSQVYTGLFRFRDSGSADDEGQDKSEAGTERQTIMETVLEQTPMAVEELIRRINELGEPVTFLGDGVPVSRAQLREKLQVPWREAPAHLNRQRAGAVASLAMSRLCGETGADGTAFEIRHPELLVSAREHVPVYLRMSQAERERAERERAERETVGQ